MPHLDIPMNRNAAFLLERAETNFKARHANACEVCPCRVAIADSLWITRDLLLFGPIYVLKRLAIFKFIGYNFHVAAPYLSRSGKPGRGDGSEDSVVFQFTLRLWKS